MTKDLEITFEDIKNNVETYDPMHQKVFDYYPFISSTFLILKNKIPFRINFKTRIASILFEVGAFYELNYKSIPLFSYEQFSDANIDLKVNYTELISFFDCSLLIFLLIFSFIYILLFIFQIIFSIKAIITVN